MDQSVLVIESPPLSPNTRLEQLKKKRKKEHVQEASLILDPFDRREANIDKQISPQERYLHYLDHGIPDTEVLPIDQHTLQQIQAMIPKTLCKNAKAIKTKTAMEDEVRVEYIRALKQSVLDYILLDPQEQFRLKIPRRPQSEIPRIARAPVPWHHSYLEAKKALEESLYITNPIISHIIKSFAHIENLVAFDFSFLALENLPVLADDFKDHLKGQCRQFREHING